MSNGIELKPMMGNGQIKSRSGSMISNLSNGTGLSNGGLKNTDRVRYFQFIVFHIAVVTV